MLRFTSNEDVTRKDLAEDSIYCLIRKYSPWRGCCGNIIQNIGKENVCEDLLLVVIVWYSAVWFKWFYDAIV
ncbi:hypothetical protein FKM82_001381 [Ascaphus truei]